ncbi:MULTISPECIES: gamma-glutamylcyclotransferase [unclassified Pseudoalteromonas]|uniref:gamma-glutamylcyclotransferase n=1 Tax=unclassified Pseudoalteromonas TaxID=194690 RepID=UPI0009E2F5E1|nr:MULTISPECIES: gamma-glutamylcyclotransferase [unclassified Pseudoalteromonas]
MDDAEKTYLYKAEELGVGYDEQIVQVINEAGESISALIYVAARIDTSLLPYSWYLNHVIIGAIENKVPVAYLNTLKSVSHKADPEA